MLGNARSKASELADLAAQRARPAATRVKQRIQAVIAALQILPPSETAVMDAIGLSAHEESCLLDYCETAYSAVVPEPFEVIAEGHVHNVRCIGCVLEDGKAVIAFRGSVFTGSNGSLDLANWLRVNAQSWSVPLSAELGGPPSTTAGASEDELAARGQPVRPPPPSDDDVEDALPPATLVHHGFQVAYLALRGAIHSWLAERHTAERPIDSICCCGHSLGGALANMCAFDLLHPVLSPWANFRVELITFGAPRVGNAAFIKGLSRCHPHVRYTNGIDPVPRLPPHPLGFCHAVPAERLERRGAASAPVAPPGEEAEESGGLDLADIEIALSEAVAAAENDESATAHDEEEAVDGEGGGEGEGEGEGAAQDVLGTQRTRSRRERAQSLAKGTRATLKVPAKALEAHMTSGYRQWLI
jgi:hypothetical protein